jgi:hypothetical protein
MVGRFGGCTSVAESAVLGIADNAFAEGSADTGAGKRASRACNQESRSMRASGELDCRDVGGGGGGYHKQDMRRSLQTASRSRSCPPLGSASRWPTRCSSPIGPLHDESKVGHTNVGWGGGGGGGGAPVTLCGLPWNHALLAASFFMYLSAPDTSMISRPLAMSGTTDEHVDDDSGTAGEYLRV